VLAPALLGWPYDRLDARHRKAFEVALHAGTAAGLGVALRREVAEVARSLDAPRLTRLFLATAPATAAGLLLHGPIAGRLSSPRHVAIAQVAAGAAMGLADRRPADRSRDDAPLLDAVAVGVAQTAALAPGVSRGGAALTALRLRRLERRSASEISRHAAAPIVLGAAALEAVRLLRRPPPVNLARPFAAGVAASFASTIAAAGLARTMDGARSYAPLAAYRIALGAVALSRLGRRRRHRIEWPHDRR
jgi:undecaprenyl-diphosphatase